MCLGGMTATSTNNAEGQQPPKTMDEIEQEVWEQMTPAAWHESVAKKGSIFCETYEETRRQIAEVAVRGNHDCILEVGSGTGDIIGLVDQNADASIADRLAEIPRFGLDINPDFVEFSKSTHNTEGRCTFLVQDVTVMLDEFWLKNGYDQQFQRPLVVCVNNTLNIMPEKLRGATVAQMLAIAGDEGRCGVSYWNGNFFSHAVMNYYKKNGNLCGKFDVNKHVNWEERHLMTPTNYSTIWHYPAEVQQLLRSFDVDVDVITDADEGLRIGEDHMNLGGLAIFAWFSSECTSRAKGYYDSDDAQKFYNNIWGEETIHIGRYDMLTSDDKSSLSNHQLISKAQEYHEADFIKLIQSKFQDSSKVRILDMGCGYGGLLRRLVESGLVWSATGCDISVKMCHQARRLNEEHKSADVIAILEESYLDTSVKDESVDLVISMDALLHVGPEGQRKAMKEASRVLRPGGWMIFSDIMQQENADPEEMQPIYNRIHLSKMGSVSNYRDAMEAVGFRNFDFLQADSSNVSSHYGTVCKVLEEKGDEIGISQEYQQNMKAGLCTWRDLAAKNIVWGFVLAQKTVKVDLDDASL
ncbi:Sarcosine/dimethylglycine N-methyltransferase [Seminavis robusta]|uniref:Sarcosine/dimethylglycine N-methyltransferase n=1 Tax=Seminavis robusta TaxID=568900 RepID=A0A9N8H7M7_9STRA|nr:Sarcosine/dimethylglycine N-methyltransferase [Seminavis robusta]|eukprot:Sro209_g087340.1 Sarcosine/dimethylglycine N-methyltransferase (583) ;mRNA; r:46940-48688